MTTAVYSVQVDIDRDSTYGHAKSDLTPYVRAMSWNNGMSSPYQEVAPPARLSITLDNSSGAFDPENTGAAYYDLLKKGTLVRVQATYSATTYTLFIGKLSMITVEPGVYGRDATLQAADLMTELLDAEYVPPLQTNATTDEVLEALFASGIIALPYATDYWVLGVSGYSELGSTTILLGAADMIDFDTGKTTLSYAGDNAGTEQGVSAQGFIRDVVAAECGGRFFFNGRTGKFTFHSRHHDVNYTIDDTLTSARIDRMTYTVQDDIVNRVTINYQPRRLGDVASVVWELDEPITLPPGVTKVITARYRDPDNESAHVGVIDPLPPAAGTDYIAYQTGTNTVITSLLSITPNWGGSSAKLQLTNGSGNLSMDVRTLRLRGTPLISHNKQSVESFDANSYVTYGLYDRTLTLRLVDDVELAQNYADSIVAQFGHGVARVTSVSFNANKDAARMALAMDCAPGTYITITDSSTSHDADYVVVGERHSVTAGGEHTHEVTLTLKPLARAQYWILGVSGFSELGSTTYPAF
jgi:hypothetical protein